MSQVPRDHERRSAFFLKLQVFKLLIYKRREVMLGYFKIITAHPLFRTPPMD